MRVKCKFNDPSNVPQNVSNNFDFGLEIGKEYVVMGMLTFKDSFDVFFLIDENGRPSWFPFGIFEIVNNELPSNWHLKINTDNQYVDYYNLLGFNELCNKEDFFNQLLEREEEAMRIYFKRKIELENSLV